MYITRSEDVFWTSYVHSIYVLWLGVSVSENEFSGQIPFNITLCSSVFVNFEQILAPCISCSNRHNWYLLFPTGNSPHVLTCIVQMYCPDCPVSIEWVFDILGELTIKNGQLKNFSYLSCESTVSISDWYFANTPHNKFDL